MVLDNAAERISACSRRRRWWITPRSKRFFNEEQEESSAITHSFQLCLGEFELDDLLICLR